MKTSLGFEFPESIPAATGRWSGQGGELQLNVHCAYNQTREAFLGLQVTAVDIPHSSLDKLVKTLQLKSGEGLWLTPFRGIPTGNVHAPLDLIYLDEKCNVIETVESFPTFQASVSTAFPASVLVLPAHSIYSSQTQVGDRLLLCIAEDMGKRLDGLESEAAAAEPLQGAVLLREQPLWSEGPGTLEYQDRSRIAGEQQERHEMGLVRPEAKPEAKFDPAARNWLKKWWSPDPRKAPREKAPGVAAYYWNGSAPGAHGIRDISSSGLYLVTEERWYPGTLILMTLQRTDCGEQEAERSISVQCRAVRWGHDGVGLQFVLAEPQKAKKGQELLLDGADRRQVERFLRQLKNGK